MNDDPSKFPEASFDASREICVCFHVPLGKLVRYFEAHHPRVASGFAQCHGAGTGCGWCVPHLHRIFEQLQNGESPEPTMSFEEYKRRRLEYHKEKRPLMPPPADEGGKLEFDLDEVIEQLPEDMKLD